MFRTLNLLSPLYIYVTSLLVVASGLGLSNPGSGILNDGIIIKLKIEETGVYRIDGSWFNQNTSLKTPDIQSNRIQVFGGIDGPLSTALDGPLPYLNELAVYINDGGDGRVDPADYILFYACDSDTKTWDAESGRFIFTKNVYDSKNYVFLKYGSGSGKRTVEKPVDPSVSPVSIYRYSTSHHIDINNLLGLFGSTQGSGQRWFGEEFSNQVIVDLASLLNFGDLVPGKPVRIFSQFAMRSASSEKVGLNLAGTNTEVSTLPVSVGEVEALHARIGTFNVSATAPTSSPEITLQFNKANENARAWIDFISLHASKNIVKGSGQLTFNNIEMLGTSPFDGLSIDGDISDLFLWDISARTDPQRLILPAGENSFGTDQDSLREFVLFGLDDALAPAGHEEIANQNLCVANNADMLLVYHPSLIKAANKFLAHRTAFSQLNILSVSTDEIYNEFSSGRQDPTAIRNFCRQLFEGDPGFKYLLLFGDASYDFRGLREEFKNESLVPTYETVESLDPLLAFPSDDYFALLDDEGGSVLGGELDIAVGRITARTPDEANAVVEKIIHYETSKESLGDWKLRLAFLADDEDNNLHINDADRIAKEVAASYPLFNQEKIYWDAFPQESTPGGNRYPAANVQLNAEIEKGLLVVNYLGHGGPRGWSQERVLQPNDIENWSNLNKLPLVITATCSFTGFDDPALTTAGEATLLNPSGGAIALFTTVRSVFASKNFRLTRSVFQEIFKEGENGNVPTIGEILMKAKNLPLNDNVNSRKFLLIGDPSLRLAIPAYRIKADRINDYAINGNEIADTVGALDFVRIKGRIVNLKDELMTDFHGELSMEVFDKSASTLTLKNDPGSLVKSFEVQKNRIFKGLVSVNDGEFTAEFRVPVDINYDFGRAKLSFYAISADGKDAGGASENLVIGGTGKELLSDQTGPLIDLYLNSETFKNGDVTHPNPRVIAYLKDDSGINLSSSSIGHEIVGLLDNNTQATYILNDFFKPTKDDYKSGSLSFPLRNLSLGHHTFKIKAFDISNNIGEQEITFVVAENNKNVFTDLFNYPNPFRNKTTFGFRHSIGITSFAAKIDIFDLSGHLVHSIRRTVVTGDGKVDGIEWDGNYSGFGKLDNGMYLFRVTLISPELKEEAVSHFEKLVILK